MDVQFYVLCNNYVKLGVVHNIGITGPAVRLRVRDEERILEAFYENPGTSVRHVAHEFGFSRYAVHHALRVMDYVRIITNVCNTFYRGIFNHGSIFVKVLSSSIFYIYDTFSVQ